MITQEEPVVATPAAAEAPRPLLRFVCARDRLHLTLSMVSRAVSKSSVDTQKMPLLGSIRMEAREGFLHLSATNLDISITTKIELVEKEEVQEGVVAVPARLFSDLVSKIPDGCKVTVSVAPGTYMLSLVHPRGTAEVTCLSAEEFLPIPGAEDGELPVLLPVSPLKEIVKAVSVAAAKDDSLPALTCLLVHVENNRLVFAATDRFRTAYQPLALSTESGVTADLLIPQRSLAELCAILPNDGMVMMSLTPNRGQVVFHTQWVTLSSRLVEGQFPNYQAAVPARENRQTRLVVKTADFREIVELTSIYANTMDGAVMISVKGSLGMEPGELSVASERSEIGSGRNAITAAVEGEDLEEPISFNARLLLDALSVTTTADVAFEIGLMKIKPKGSEQTITAPAAVLRAVGTNTCTHSFMAMATNT